jgi:hypothetical protein
MKIEVDVEYWEQIAALLNYSMDEIDWEYNSLTSAEQLIVRSADNLKAIEEMVRTSLERALVER